MLNDNELNFMTDLFQSMKSSSLQNYFLDGLTSSLLGKGKVRLFEASRHQTQSISPHTHRYDFSCLVLQGHVTNHIWEQKPSISPHGDLFNVIQLEYLDIGSYKQKFINTQRYKRTSLKFNKGDFYSMLSHQFHNITFSKDAVVLFIEGPQLRETSWALLPNVTGKESSTVLGDL